MWESVLKRKFFFQVLGLYWNISFPGNYLVSSIISVIVQIYMIHVFDKTSFSAVIRCYYTWGCFFFHFTWQPFLRKRISNFKFSNAVSKNYNPLLSERIIQFERNVVNNGQYHLHKSIEVSPIPESINRSWSYYRPPSSMSSLKKGDFNCEIQIQETEKNNPYW